MYIVINGGGKVGSFLGRTLVTRGHVVVVIEKREKVCGLIAKELPEVIVICGDGCDIKYLEEAGMGRADVFVSVTGDDDDNLVACQLAKASFDVPRTVARVNNPKNESIFQKLGIDAISTTTIISHLVEEEATIGDIITLHALKRGKLALVEVELPTEYCKVCNKQIKQLGLPEDCVLVSVIRGDEVLLPKGETELQPGDTIIAVTSPEKEQKLKEILT